MRWTPHGRTELIGWGATIFGITLTTLYFYPWLAILPAALLVLLFSFFRDPDRTVPTEPGVIVAPADGKVTDVQEMPENEYIGGPALRVGIFLSIFDVHVNRAPCAGVVEHLKHRPGKYLDARNPNSATENERQDVGLLAEGPDGRPMKVLVRQISGLIARRIVCPLTPGKHLERGERYGMIKFGSRTEVYLPVEAGFEAAVQPGDRVRGGETVLGRLRGSDSTVESSAEKEQAPSPESTETSAESVGLETREEASAIEPPASEPVESEVTGPTSATLPDEPLPGQASEAKAGSESAPVPPTAKAGPDVDARLGEGSSPSESAPATSETPTEVESEASEAVADAPAPEEAMEEEVTHSERQLAEMDTEAGTVVQRVSKDRASGAEAPPETTDDEEQEERTPESAAMEGRSEQQPAESESPGEADVPSSEEPRGAAAADASEPRGSAEEPAGSDEAEPPSGERPQASADAGDRSQRKGKNRRKKRRGGKRKQGQGASGAEARDPSAEEADDEDESTVDDEPSPNPSTSSSGNQGS